MTQGPTIDLLDGRKIPWLAWGNGTGDAKKNPVEVGKLVVGAGLRHIDTAQGYDNEKETGAVVEAVSLPRDELWVTSKLSQEGGATDKDRVPVADIRKRVAETTERLGTVPDLFLIHNPFVPPDGTLLEAWKEFEALKDEGKLKSIGVSNFRPQDLELILSDCKHKPVVNQIEYHPYLLTHLAPVIATHQAHGIVTEAYGPLSPLLRHPTGGPLKPVLERIAERVSRDTGKKIDAAAVLLLWTRGTGAVAVTASGNSERIKQFALIDTLPDLHPGELVEISRVGSKVHFRAYAEHMEVDFPVPNLPSE